MKRIKLKGEWNTVGEDRKAEGKTNTSLNSEADSKWFSRRAEVRKAEMLLPCLFVVFTFGSLE